MRCQCQGCCHSLGKEFQLHKFSLAHEPADDFFKSQWQSGSRSIWWFIYRCLLALVFVLGVVGSLINSFNGGKWFIYLTNWGFLLVMYTCVFGAILVGCYQFQMPHFAVKSWILKMYWASHWSTMVIALLITFVYWAFLYPAYEDPSPTGNYNLWAHAFNSILMLLDHMLVAFPSRLLHFVYPFIFGFTYMFFSLIYYFAGGTDVVGNRYIYPILDWSEPGNAMITVCGCVVLVLALCCLLYSLYRLRSFIGSKQNKGLFAVNA